MIVYTGKNCNIEGVTFKGSGQAFIGDNVTIKNNTIINVDEELHIGNWSTINENCVIEGRNITIGNCFWMEKYSLIGGGGCHSKHGILKAGDFLHLGRFSSVNIAKEVIIGNEVGIGEGSHIYTHGAYLSYLDGFPVKFNNITIGSNVWLPNAIVTANIGSNVVVGVMSFINKDIPSNCFAAGNPCRIIKTDYPPKLSNSEFLDRIETLLDNFTIEYAELCRNKDLKMFNEQIFIDGTLFDMKEKKIDGRITELTEKWKDYLRRNGIRFKYWADKDSGIYQKW